MRKRDLVRSLKNLRSARKSPGFVPTLSEVRKLVIEDYQRLLTIEAMLPEIIDKLEFKP